jgi:hypothetical protein
VVNYILALLAVMAAGAFGASLLREKFIEASKKF